MSDVTRYNFDTTACWYEHPDGEFVEHDAYAKLAAEAQALREEVAELRARVVVVPERDARRMDTEYPEGWNDCLDELARLNGKTVSEGLLRRVSADPDYEEVFTMARGEALTELLDLLSEQEGGKP
ncbi:TPA: hypothetical protein NEF99_001042 [Pseudomonas aeruginosa]|nr:hypothetical protein [Pseudomonas aeruginosa]